MASMPQPAPLDAWPGGGIEGPAQKLAIEKIRLEQQVRKKKRAEIKNGIIIGLSNKLPKDAINNMLSFVSIRVPCTQIITIHDLNRLRLPSNTLPL